jgi:hypothetical protein
VPEAAPRRIAREERRDLREREDEETVEVQHPSGATGLLALLASSIMGGRQPEETEGAYRYTVRRDASPRPMTSRDGRGPRSRAPVRARVVWGDAGTRLQAQWVGERCR